MHGYAKGKLIATQLAVLQAAGSAETNLTATARNGTTVTNAAGTHTKGAYATLMTPAYDVFGLLVIVHTVVVAATDTGLLVDIAYGAGDTIVIPDINAGQAAINAIGGASTAAGGGKAFYFPGLNIPAGNAIKARSQTTVNNDSVGVVVFTESRSRYVGVVENSWVAYGVNAASSRGTSVTPASGAFGAWTEIGTTAQNHKLWQVGMDLLGNTNVGATTNLIEIGVGPNSGAVTSMGFAQSDEGSSEVLGHYGPAIAYPTSSGDKVWCRIAGAGTTAVGIIIYGGG